MQPYLYELEVRFRDLDALGHVNNADYLTYFECARAGFWQERVAAFTDFNPGFLVVSANCNYRSPAHFSERLQIEVSPTRVGNSSFELAYRIMGPDGRLVADGSTVQVCVDPETGKSRPVPPEWRAKLGG